MPRLIWRIALAGSAGFSLMSCTTEPNTRSDDITFYEVACGTPGSFKANIVPLAGAPSTSAGKSAQTDNSSTATESDSTTRPSCLLADLKRSRRYGGPGFFGRYPDPFHMYGFSAYGWPYGGYGFNSIGWGHSAGHGFGHHRGH